MKLVLGALEFIQPPFDFRGVICFLRSLREYYTGDVVFFTRNLPVECKKILDYFNVEQIDKTEFERKYNIVRLGINATRRIYYYLYLKEYTQYSDILMADVFDVIFQGNPFPDTIPEESAIISEEAKNIEDCKINSGWIYNAYGSADYIDLKTLSILCAGLIRGGYYGTLKVNQLFIEEVKSMQGKPVFGTLDQAHFEYIFHKKNFLKSILPYNNPLMMHIGHTPVNDISINQRGLILVKGTKPIMLHQYNRHKDLMDFIYKTYSD